jgi:hypothetical protein
VHSCAAPSVLTELLTELGRLAHRGGPTGKASGGERLQPTTRGRAGAEALTPIAADIEDEDEGDHHFATTSKPLPAQYLFLTLA